MAVACPGVDSQVLATILDPFRDIFADLGPDRQMSAVETGQMSADETRQMSSVARADICLVSTHNVDVSEVSIVAMSQCSSRR